MLLAMVSTLLVLAATSCAQTATESKISITQSGFSPSPLELTQKMGSTHNIQWVNDTSSTVTITSDTGMFNSGAITPGGSYSYTFTDTGSYSYHEAMDPAMKGEITITEK